MNAKKDFNGNPRNTRCSADKGVFEAIAEGIANGWYPEDAMLGPFVGGLPKPPTAIAEVTVRSRESFYIVLPAGKRAIFNESLQKWESE